MTAVDVDALDKLREEIRDDLAGWPIGSGYYSTTIGTDDAAELADALFAGSLAPLLAEVRRGRALRDFAEWVLSLTDDPPQRRTVTLEQIVARAALACDPELAAGDQS